MATNTLNIWYNYPTDGARPAQIPGYQVIKSGNYYTYVTNSEVNQGTYPVPPVVGTKVGNYGVILNNKGQVVESPTSQVGTPWAPVKINLPGVTTGTSASGNVNGNLGNGYLTMPSVSQLMSSGSKLTYKQALALQGVEIPTSASVSADGNYTITGADLLNALNGLTAADLGKAGKGLNVQNVSESIKNALGFNSFGPNVTPAQAAATIATYIPNTGDLGQVPTPNTMQLIGTQNKELKQATDANAPINVALSGATQTNMYNAIASTEAYVANNFGITDTSRDPNAAKEIDDLITKWAKSGITNQNELLADVRATNIYQQAFPGLTQYRNSGGKMTEAEYMNYRDNVRSFTSAVGAPTLTDAQIGQMINSNIKVNEYQQRLNDIYAQVELADPGTLAALQKEYGINKSDVAHYVMTGELPNAKKGTPGSAQDPYTLGQMQRQVASANIQDYAQRVGLPGIGAVGTGQLADMAKLSGSVGNQGLGYGITQIENSLLAASRDVALTKALPGAGTPTVDTKTLIASQLAGFGGINQVAAQTQVARAEQAKVAPFEKGGGYAEDAKGVVGIGSART